MRTLLLALPLLLWAASAQAAVQKKVIGYKHGDVVLEGYLVYDDAAQGKRPGVLVVHDWTGHNPYARMRAEQLASLGYVAFALDMYGKGVRAKDPKEASTMAAVYKNDRKLMRARAAAGFDVLRQQPQVDPDRLAAIGYCFGGTTALELARDGAALAGVVSFHGGLSTPTPQDARNIKAKVLVLHGADDPHVPPAEVAAFEDEMRKGGIDWQLVAYGGAVHSFTNKAAGNDPSQGNAYNARADHRSWEAMKGFFAEIFQASQPVARPVIE
jgi:dienelactone hydrolase